MVEEIWRDIPGFEGNYQVSNIGRVKSLKHKIKILSASRSSRYKLVTLFKNGKRTYKKIHRLVAETFLKNPNNLPCVNHKDENPLNNSVENLEWCSYKYNSNYGTGNQRKAESLKGKSVPLKYKPVEQLTLDGDLICTYSAVKDVEKMGYKPSTISNCCYGRTKTAYGFLWRFKKEAD